MFRLDVSGNVGKDARVVLAPDSFGGTLTALEAAEAMALGWHWSRPSDDLCLTPMSDGGPGFVQSVLAAPGSTAHRVTVSDPLGRAVQATIVVRAHTAYIEVAQACGLDLVLETERNPRLTSTIGVGQLILHALRLGVRQIVVGLGGSCTNDGGVGALAALGAVFRDAAGTPVNPIAANLASIREADLSAVPDALRGPSLLLATDVDSVLLGPGGATQGFSRQKGADDVTVAALEAGMTTFAAALEQASGRVRLSDAAGAGAAGGLGFGLMALGAGRRAGFSVVADLLNLRDRISRSDLVITGEGRLDWQSLRGKVVHGIATLSKRENKPCLAVAGVVEQPERVASELGLAHTFSLADHVGSAAEARRNAAAVLADVCWLVACNLAGDRRP